MKDHISIILLAVLAFLSTSCNQGIWKMTQKFDDLPKPSEIGLGSGTEATISFAEVEASAFQNCSACHGGAQAPRLMSYSDYKANITAVYDTVVTKRSMPRGQPLTEEQVQLVKDWINEGAPQFVSNQPAPTTTTTTTLPPTTTTLGQITTTLPGTVTTTTTLPSPTTTTLPKVTFNQVYQSSLKTCMLCHTAGNESPTLVTYQNFKNNITRVNLTVVVQKTMPKGQNLTAAQIQLVKDWIDQGAPEL